MGLIERIVRVALLIVGIAAVYYIAATPGDQFWVAAIGGACIGMSVSFMLRK